MRINFTEYIDGFFKLSTKIKGKTFSITYSDDTDIDEAITDFREQVREKVQDVFCMPSDLPSNGVADDER